MTVTVMDGSYDCEEVALLLGISRSSVLGLIKNNVLVAQQTEGKGNWRIDPRSVEEHLTRQIHEAETAHKRITERLEATKEYLVARTTMRNAQLTIDRITNGAR